MLDSGSGDEGVGSGDCGSGDEGVGSGDSAGSIVGVCAVLLRL